MHDIHDATIRHQHYIERFKTNQTKLLNGFVESIELALYKALGSQTTFRSTQKIKRVLDKLYKTALDEFKEFIAEYSGNLDAFGGQQLVFNAEALNNLADGVYKIPAVAQLRAAAYAKPFANTLLKDALNDFSRSQARLLKNTVSLGFAEGQTNQSIISRIIGTPEFQGRDGALQVTRNTASRLVRTSIQHMASVAQESVYKANDDLITEYAWVSTLDSRTSGVCRSLDGNVYSVGKGRMPPAHQNCRSSTVPIFDNESYIDDEGIKRSSFDGMRPQKGANGTGRTSAKTNYNDWLGRQSKSFQEDILGKDKAKLFRNGGLTMDKFMADDRELTLDELRKKFPKAWGKSGISPQPTV